MARKITISKNVGGKRVPLWPVRSTYLDHALLDVNWKVGYIDLAFSGKWCDWHRGCPRVLASLGVLPDAAGWCDDCSGGSLGLLGGLAVGETSVLAAAWATGGAAVLHDLIERLVEFSRHGDGGGCRYGMSCCGVVV